MGKKSLNWNEVGRVVAVFLELFKLIRDTFTNQRVGLEIVGWLVGEGKGVFVEKFLKPLGNEFLTIARIIKVDENTILVNLDAPPVLPFPDAKVRENKGGGWVTVQKREDDLYVDGRKVILFQPVPYGCRREGYQVQEEIARLAVLHPNIMDALYEYDHLIPKEWKKTNDEIPLISFFAVTFDDENGINVHVRIMYYIGFRGWRWKKDHQPLYSPFSNRDVVAILED